ncbi:MAG: ubiquitin-conjugating enzyme E2, partial [Planctomycetes bacterium]|nr:ubiquitin-conjugating enzyme E2 [Planctomycetota bacterium]
MSMRLKRLQADYERLSARCAASRHISIRSTKGNPPERYEIEYAVKGLRVDAQGQIVEAVDHVVEIVLTREYPRQAPQCKMLTPMFHPNIDPAAICIGDHWAASEALSDLVVRVAEMIAYQSYNTKSPLNGEAARWADQHQAMLPIDPVDLWPAEDVDRPRIVQNLEDTAKTEGERQCANCGNRGAQARLEADSGGRLICSDCAA